MTTPPADIVRALDMHTDACIDVLVLMQTLSTVLAKQMRHNMVHREMLLKAMRGLVTSSVPDRRRAQSSVLLTRHLMLNHTDPIAPTVASLQHALTVEEERALALHEAVSFTSYSE